MLLVWGVERIGAEGVIRHFVLGRSADYAVANPPVLSPQGPAITLARPTLYAIYFWGRGLDWANHVERVEEISRV